MPLLTELEKGSVGWRFYKHGAPNGAFASVGNGEILGLGFATQRQWTVDCGLWTVD